MCSCCGDMSSEAVNIHREAQSLVGDLLIELTGLRTRLSNKTEEFKNKADNALVINNIFFPLTPICLWVKSALLTEQDI